MTLRTILAATVIVGAVAVIIRYGARVKTAPVRASAIPVQPVEVPVRRAEAQ